MAAKASALFERNAVDWDVVDEELDHIGPEYKQHKFHSLSHVVDILSSVDPQGLVSEVPGLPLSQAGPTDTERSPRSYESSPIAWTHLSIASCKGTMGALQSQSRTTLRSSTCSLTPRTRLAPPLPWTLTKSLVTALHPSPLQVDGLKKSLAEASRHLAAQSRHLHQQVRGLASAATAARPPAC
jgi:hypothetical protein